MLKILILACCLLLASCASSPRWLENRLACTLDGKELHVLSKWGRLSIGSEIAAVDAAVACQR